MDYEHVSDAGSQLWRLLFHLYQQFFENFSVSKFLKTGIILQSFKGKGAKANNKDNYRGIMLSPTLRKIYEMILLNRLENFAADNEYFSELQFGFRKGVGCIKPPSLYWRQSTIRSTLCTKFYLNSLLKVLTDQCYAISVNRLSLPSPSFVDDISLLTLYPSFPETLWIFVTRMAKHGDMNF